MHRWGRRIALAFIGLGVVLGVLYIAVPPAKTAADGAADPVLWARKPVVKGLYRLGVPRPFGPRDWIPASSETTTWSGDKDSTFDTADSATRVTWMYEPVYRGIFWRDGGRATVKVDLRGDAKDDPHHVRLWMRTAKGGEKTTIADGHPGGLDPASGLRRFRVDGYVPGSAWEYGFDCIAPDGSVGWGNSWGGD